jgi:hypothetical protein
MTTHTLSHTPSEQARINASQASLDTIQLRIVPAAPPMWRPGLIRPGIVHLLSTRDGQPHTVELDGQPVRVGVCGVAVASPTAALEPTSLPGTSGLPRCARCEDAYQDLYRSTDRGGRR